MQIYVAHKWRQSTNFLVKSSENWTKSGIFRFTHRKCIQFYAIIFTVTIYMYFFDRNVISYEIFWRGAVSDPFQLRRDYPTGFMDYVLLCVEYLNNYFIIIKMITFYDHKKTVLSDKTGRQNIWRVRASFFEATILVIAATTPRNIFTHCVCVVCRESVSFFIIVAGCCFTLVVEIFDWCSFFSTAFMYFTFYQLAHILIAIKIHSYWIFNWNQDDKMTCNILKKYRMFKVML